MSELPDRIHIVGAGLIGASVGLALRGTGAHVTLADASPTTAALARDLGAGELPDGPRTGPAADDDGAAAGAGQDHDPDLVVVATPPDVAARVVRDQLARHPGAVVTDVASVKAAVAAELAASGADLSRYVGSHPMAGRERSGAVAAQAYLFEGRTWVICPGQARPDAVARVDAMARATGAAVVRMDAAEHDAAVAVVSHLPQLAASLVAARLRDLPDGSVALAGQGVRDVTRIAASDPTLWTQILAGNAAALHPVVRQVAADVGAVADALAALEQAPAATDGAPGARHVLARTIADGQLGHARIPGKHGAAATAYATVTVVIPDRAGSLGRLFTDVGAAGVSVEDLRMEHGVGMPVGVAELDVLPAAVERLREVLTDKGWSVHV